MKKLLFASLVLAVSASAVSPAFAGFVYVPVLDRTGSGGSKHTTEVWVSNNGTEERRYATFFLPAGSGGIQRSGTSTKATVLGGRTVKLVGISGVGAPGLLEIEGGTQVLVEARMSNAPSGGFGAATAVPVISSENALAPNAVAELLALSRDTSGAYTDLEVVNLGNQAAQCAIQLFRADGTQIGSTAKVAVPPLALRHFGDVFTVLGVTSVADARARVACNQTFFAFAGIFNPARTLLTFATPAASGASTLAGPNAPPQGETIVFEQSGQVHKPVLGNETRQITVPVPRALSLKRVTIDWDVVPGPWTASKPDGNHNLIWVHRGKYRSNTLANVNTFGPPRSGIKNTQNLDMAARALTLQEVPLVLQEGVSYHFHYVYNAETNRVTLTVTSQGSTPTTVATLDMEGSAASRLITVPATGLIVQFGHTAAQAAEGIEFPTYGWVYSNLRIEMAP
jgi:hypothetical protein